VKRDLSHFVTVTVSDSKANLYYTQAWKQTSGDPSGVNWNYNGITLSYKFTAPCYLWCRSQWLELWSGCWIFT